MNMKDFIARLVPSARRNEIDESLDHIDKTVDHALSLLELYSDAITDQHIEANSTFSKELDKQFIRKLKMSSRGHWLTHSRDIMRRASGIVGEIRDEYFSNTQAMVNTQLPLDRLMALRSLATVTFLADYLVQVTRKFAEEENMHLTRERIKRPLPIEKYLDSNRNAAFDALELIQNNNITKLLKELPNVDVDQGSYDELLQSQGRTRVDPMRFGLLSIPTNPFHYIGIKWASWYAARYRKLKEEKRLLECRLQQLRQLAGGEADAKLDKAIGYYEDEVNKLNAKLTKMEE